MTFGEGAESRLARRQVSTRTLCSRTEEACFFITEALLRLLHISTTRWSPQRIRNGYCPTDRITEVSGDMEVALPTILLSLTREVGHGTTTAISI